jgi:hypothetical protein
MISKKSSLSPPQRIGPAPAKEWSSKLKINSYYEDGRGCGPMDELKAGQKPETMTVTNFRDHKGEK